MYNKTLKTVAAAVALMVSGGVYAAACTQTGTGTSIATTSDVTYSANYPAGPFIDSTACNVFFSDGPGGGNIDAGDLNALWNVPTPGSDPAVYPYGTGVFQGAGKDEGAPGSGTVTLFGGNYTFTITALDDDGNASGIGDLLGMYSITAVLANPPGMPDPGLPFYIDFVLGLKGATATAAYLFDEAYFDGSGGGSWVISFENKGGEEPTLSNMVLFVREGSTDPGTPPTAIPEPGSLALLGGALFGLWAVRRRKEV